MHVRRMNQSDGSNLNSTLLRAVSARGASRGTDANLPSRNPAPSRPLSQSPRETKAASHVLQTVWSYKELRNTLSKDGWNKTHFQVRPRPVSPPTATLPLPPPPPNQHYPTRPPHRSPAPPLPQYNNPSLPPPQPTATGVAKGSKNSSKPGYDDTTLPLMDKSQGQCPRPPPRPKPGREGLHCGHPAFITVLPPLTPPAFHPVASLVGWSSLHLLSEIRHPQCFFVFFVFLLFSFFPFLLLWKS